MMFTTRLKKTKCGQAVYGDGNLIKNEDEDVFVNCNQSRQV